MSAYIDVHGEPISSQKDQNFKKPLFLTDNGVQRKVCRAINLRKTYIYMLREQCNNVGMKRKKKSV
jgi:hypothetical protein